MDDCKRPPDLPAGALTLRRRNKLNRGIEDYNDDAILARKPLKAYWAYSSQEVQDLAANQQYCDDVGPLPCFLWGMIQAARIKIGHGLVKNEEKYAVNFLSSNLGDPSDEDFGKPTSCIQKLGPEFDLRSGITAKQEVTKQVKRTVYVEVPPLPAYVKHGEAKVKQEDSNHMMTVEDGDRVEQLVWHIKKEEADMKQENEWAQPESMLLPRDAERDTREDDDKDVDPNMIQLTPTHATIGRRDVNRILSATPTPSKFGQGYKRRRLPSPNPTRNLRPRTAQQDYQNMHRGTPEPNSPRATQSSSRATAIPPLSIESQGESDDEGEQRIISRPQLQSTKRSVPPLQPGDEHRLSRKEYCRRSDGKEGIKVEEASINLHEALRAVPPDLYIDFEALDMHIGQETFAISRSRWSKLFGGSQFGTETTATKQPNPRYRNMLFLNREYNPDAPQMAGEGGLYMESEDDPTKPNVPRHPKWEEKDYVVVTKVRNNEWRLIGLGRVRGLDSLTPAEWRNLNPVCKATWLNNIDKKGWGREHKARVRLRRGNNGREPSAKMVKEVVEAEKSKSKEFPDVTRADIEKCFLDGKSRLQVYQIEIIEYPHAIQRYILDNTPQPN